MSSLMSEVELLAKLRAWYAQDFPVSFDIEDAGALSLLTAWRDAAVRAEREACAAHLEWLADMLPSQDDADRLRSAARSVRIRRARNTEPEQHG